MEEREQIVWWASQWPSNLAPVNTIEIQHTADTFLSARHFRLLSFIICYLGGIKLNISYLPGEQLTTASNHAMVEVAEYKAKLRKLRQQLEEKTEQWSEVREEVEKLQETTDKLKSENLELCQDARAAKTYRDELDVLRERAEKVSCVSLRN